MCIIHVAVRPALIVTPFAHFDMVDCNEYMTICYIIFDVQQHRAGVTANTHVLSLPELVNSTFLESCP